MTAIPTAHLPPGIARLQSRQMDDYKEHWRLRLKEIFERTGLSQVEFANRIDIAPDYLSRLLYEPGKKGRKNVGPSIMRKVQQEFSLPPGWFDLPLGHQLPYTPTDAAVPAPTVQEPAPRVIAGIKPRRGIEWPFKIVTYQRIDKVRRHFSSRGMPSAMADIDKHLDVLVARWEIEMARQKRAGD